MFKNLEKVVVIWKHLVRRLRNKGHTNRFELSLCYINVSLVNICDIHTCGRFVLYYHGKLCLWSWCCLSMDCSRWVTQSISFETYRPSLMGSRFEWFEPCTAGCFRFDLVLLGLDLEKKEQTKINKIVSKQFI